MIVKDIKTKGQRFYVVFEGLHTGVFSSWEKCAPSVIGYSGSVYKSFKTEDEAVEAYRKYIISTHCPEDVNDSDEGGVFSSDSLNMSPRSASIATNNSRKMKTEERKSSFTKKLYFIIFCGGLVCGITVSYFYLKLA